MISGIFCFQTLGMGVFRRVFFRQQRCRLDLEISNYSHQNHQSRASCTCCFLKWSSISRGFLDIFHDSDPQMAIIGPENGGVSDAKAALQTSFIFRRFVAGIPQTGDCGDCGDCGDHPRNLENGCTNFALNPDFERQNRGISPENERGAQVHPDAFLGCKCGYLSLKCPDSAFSRRAVIVVF